MIGTAVDRAVSWFAPAAAVRRQQARRVYERTTERSYDGARTDRRNAYWRTQNRSADLELSESADVMRSRARALVRDNAYARGIIQARARNIVGTGIRPQAAIVDGDALNVALESLWNRWQRQCDVGGRLSFYEMQQLAMREADEAGECLVRFVRREQPGRVLPLALEMIEADRFATDHFVRGRNPESGNEVVRGVELNADGQPVTYWLYESHPRGVNSYRQEAKPHPASQFLHLYRQERIGQTRGVTIFAPVIRWLQDLGYYVENELQSSAIASCFSAAITTMAGGADGGLLDDDGDSASDTDGNRFDGIQPGLVGRLMPGEDIKVINPTRNQSEAQTFVNLMLRSMAVGTGLSYERLSRDYSQTNYSSNRASDLEDRREFRPIQDWITGHLCIPVWERFVESAVLNSKVPISAADYIREPERYHAHKQHPPGWEWVDPVKEQRASAEAVDSLQSTLADEAGKRGKDWRDIIDQRAIELNYAREKGVAAEMDTREETAEVSDAE